MYKFMLFALVVAPFSAQALDDPYAWQGDASQYEGRDLEAEIKSNYDSLPEETRAEADNVVKELRDNREAYSAADDLAQKILTTIANMTAEQRKEMQSEANDFILDFAQKEHNLSDKDLASLKEALDNHQVDWDGPDNN